MIEFDDEKDGSVSIDFCAGEGKMLTISVESSGEIYWALHWDGHRDHGKHKMQKRTWVGLTEDDKVLIKHDANFNQFMTAGEYADRVQQLTEARLKDKNNG